jgi:hypothetical protein
MGRESEWRVGHEGRDAMYCEQRHDDTRQRIRSDGDTLMGRTRHPISFASSVAWRQCSSLP